MKSTGVVFDWRPIVGAEPHATTLFDRSRYGSNGAITTAVWKQQPSGIWALDFVRANPDYIEIPADQTQLNFTSEDFSLVARIKVDNLDVPRNIFQRGLVSTDGWRSYIHSNGKVIVYTFQAPTAQSSQSSAGSIVAGNWHTVGMSRSGASIRIYIDGVDDTDTAGTHIDPLTCARTAKIGIRDDLSSNPFDGKIAYLGIWNYALSPSQHRKMHDALKYWT